MSTRKKIITFLPALLAVLGFAVLAAATGPQEYVLTGKITAIDLPHRTVVVEAPVGTQQFTVAGPLAPDARLIRQSRSVRLNDFKPGERVRVKWRHTDKGHLILELATR